MIPKTGTRYTARNSLISEMTLICVVSTTHFDISTEFQRKIEDDMKVNDEGVSLLYNLVSKLHNNLPTLHIKPKLIFSIDDTVNCIYDGLGNDKDEFPIICFKSNSEIRSKI